MSILRFIHFLIRYFRVEIENCCCVVLAYFSGSRNSRISVSIREQILHFGCRSRSHLCEDCSVEKCFEITIFLIQIILLHFANNKNLLQIFSPFCLIPVQVETKTPCKWNHYIDLPCYWNTKSAHIRLILCWESAKHYRYHVHRLLTLNTSSAIRYVDECKQSTKYMKARKTHTYTSAPKFAFIQNKLNVIYRPVLRDWELSGFSVLLRRNRYMGKMFLNWI